MQANIVEEEVVAIANEPYPNEQQVCNEEESISNEEETDNEVLATMDSEVVSIADNDVQSPAVQEMDDARISIMIRYNKSFKAKLIQADDTVKNYYCELKNLIMSNKKVTSRLSWACDSINIGRTKLVKFNVRGKTLYVYLALDPNEFADSKIKVEVAKGKRFASTPCLCKIKNPRRFNVAKQLIEKLSEKFALQHVETEPQDYYLAYETTENLIESKLIKELVSKDKYNSFQ